MSASDDKASIFLRNIGEEAQRQKELLEEEIKLILDGEQEEAEREAKALSDAFLKREKTKFFADLNREHTNQLTLLRSEMSSMRENIVEEIFEDLRQELSDFVRGADYSAYLVRSAKKLADFLKGKPLTFFVKPQDLDHIDLILSQAPAASSVREDLNIKIGGIRAEAADSGLCPDLSLDSALAKAKEDFYQNNLLFNSDHS